MRGDESTVLYDLRIQPLRQDPDLTAKIVDGIKATLGAMFADPFAVRDVVLTVREVVDNIVTHANWDHPKQPTIHVWYEVLGEHRRFNVFARNAVRDPEEAQKRVAHLNGTADTKTAADILGRRLIEGYSDASKDGQREGIGLLQIASSPRCYLNANISGDLFSIQVNVRVPEMRVR